MALFAVTTQNAVGQMCEVSVDATSENTNPAAIVALAAAVALIQQDTTILPAQPPT